MTGKIKGRSLLERASDEASLLHEIWLTAVSDAFQRDLTHRLTGATAAELLADYFAEHEHMRRFFDRHVEARTCALAIAELRSDQEKGLPKPRDEKPRNSELKWMDPFRAPPMEVPARAMPEPPVLALAEDPIARPRGPRPAKFLSTLDAMKAHDPADLNKMTEEVMKATFGASRDVCRKARATIWSEALSNK